MDELHQSWRVIWGRGIIFGRRRAIIRALDTIGRLGRPPVVADIFHLTLSRDSKISVKAGQVVAQLMKKVKRHEWTRLYASFQYIRVFVKHLDTLANFPKHIAIELLGVASLNSSSYVRQEAVRRLSTIALPRAIPYVTLRLADWVDPVRETALTTTYNFLRTDLAKEYINYWYLIDWMSGVKRVDLSGVRQDIIDSLFSGESCSEALGFLDDSDPSCRLFCLKAVEDKLFADTELLEKARVDKAPHIRLWLARRVIESDQIEAKQLLEPLLMDRSPRVRTVVMMALVSDNWNDIRERISEMIYDDSPSVRETARYLLRQHDLSEFAPLYREKIKTAEQIRPGLICGLGETGNAEDSTLIEEFIGHHRAKIKAAALSAMGRIAPAQAGPIAVELLDDISSRPRRVAVSVLGKLKDFSLMERVKYVIEKSSFKGKRASLHVLLDYNCWQSLLSILGMLSRSEESLEELGWRAFDRWHTRWFIRSWNNPNAEDISAIKERFSYVCQSNSIPPLYERKWHDLGRMIESGILSR